MSRSGWSIVAAVALLAIPIELMIGFGMWFSPGWANLQRGGPEIYAIWPAGLSAVVFLIFMSIAAAAGAVLAAALGPWPRRAFLIFLALATVPALVVTVWVYWVLHADAVAMWPNGYNP